MANKGHNCIGFHLPGVLTLIASLGACAAPQIKIPDIPALENQPRQDIPAVDLLHVSPEMRSFALRHSPSENGAKSRAWSLAYAALDPYLLDFEYDPLITLPADRAFEAGTGNCLTFSSLFIAMAREAGLDAWYQEVEIPPMWSNVNDTMLVGKHVNAVVRDRRNSYTVDVSRRKSQSVEQVRRLSDTEANAQYHNNLGVEALIDQNLGLAYAYFSKALETDSRLDYIWSNLGVVFRRNEQTDDAIFAYQTALKIKPQQSVALNNLYVIFEEDGELELVKEFRFRVEKNRQKNPYYLHYLAEIANEERRYSDAIKLLDRAIRIDNNEYRFYYTLAQSQFHTGKTDVAQHSLEQARHLAPSSMDVSEWALPGDSL
jgi:Flp pilus assembly protein TadD